jgi:hypothetical protein
LFSEICSCSRLITLRAFNRLVDAMEDSAMQLFIVSCSASRSKALPFLPFLSLSFLDFLFAAEDDPLEKNDVGVDLPLDWA